MTDETIPEGILSRSETRRAELLLREIRWWRGDDRDRASALVEPHLAAFVDAVKPIHDASAAHWEAEDAKPLTLPSGVTLVPGRRYDITVKVGWRGDRTQTLRRRTLIRVNPPSLHSESRTATFSGSSYRGKEVTVIGKSAALSIVEIEE